MISDFNNNHEQLQTQYADEVFREEDVATLSKMLNPNAHTPSACAENYRIFAAHTPICIVPFDLFPDHFGGFRELRTSLFDGYSRTYAAHPELRSRERKRWSQGAYRAEIDFDHVTPDWHALLTLGFAGLAKRLHRSETCAFRQAAAIACESVCHLFSRLSDTLTHRGLDDLASMCKRLSCGAPQTLHDALELIIVTHRLLDTEVASICTLGGLDRLLDPFVEHDLNAGLHTRDEIVALLAEFFIKYDASARNNPQKTASYLGKSFFIGGLTEDDTDVTNQTTFLLIDAVVKADVLAPKLAIRLSEKTPSALYKRISRFIRDENGHAVLCNDRAAIKGLVRTGISEADAYEYAPIGCYEPAVVGREIGCTGATSLNIAKAVELALYAGRDPLSGEQISDVTPLVYPDFAHFYAAVKLHLKHLADEIKETQRTWEAHYPEISPALLLSSTIETCVVRGKSAYDGGASYANTACNCGCIGSAADSLFMIKKLVYDQKKYTLVQLAEILASDWENHEVLRNEIRLDREKWGNDRADVDALAKDLADETAALFSGEPNGRGGVFKPGLYSIDRSYYFGHATGATPDGRRAREVLSRNLCPTIGMDFAGVTAEINSVLKLDHTSFPNGSVLDLMLHPSTVNGDGGLNVLEALIRAYVNGGGFGIQFNIFDAETLRAAQNEPDKYRNLQIRLCGWNVYFVNLTKEQQDDFIREAEKSII